MADETTWSGSLHQTFRLLPRDNQSGNLRPFLEADGLTPEELLAKLPYDRARTKDPTKTSPDALGHHRERGSGPHARLGQQDSYLFRPDRPLTPSFASNRRNLRALADMDSRQRVAPQA